MDTKRKMHGVLVPVVVGIICWVFSAHLAFGQQTPYPTSWNVNCNGYIGLLIYKYNPQTKQVTGALLGTPVEGFLVGRHLMLHRNPKGNGQLYDGWILDPKLGAQGQPYYSGDYFIAGTVSEFKGSVDGVYPWYGTAAKGGSGGTQKVLRLSCQNKENAEKGCCCFLGAHTYKFPDKYVRAFDLTFDTGRGFNCKSNVMIQIYRANKWETMKTVAAVSSSGNSGNNLITVNVPVNSKISGIRVADNCVCCIDNSSVVIYFN